jgi:starch phosphorylase
MIGFAVEIAEEVGEEQCFLFGHLTPDVDHVRYLNKYQAAPLNERCAELAKVRAKIRTRIYHALLTMNWYDRYSMLLRAACSVMVVVTLACLTPLSELTTYVGPARSSSYLIAYPVSPQYLVGSDFESYVRAQALADELFTKDHEEWVRRTMLTTARCGKFSSDRAVATYAEEVSRKF